MCTLKIYGNFDGSEIVNSLFQQKDKFDDK